MKLDEYDLKLINLLKDNSRLSISDLAKLLGLSRPTVKSHLEKLEKGEIIQKYTVKLSPLFERAGELVILIVETRRPEIFKEYDEIVEVNKITSLKYVIKVVMEKMDGLMKIINEEGLEVLEIMPVLESEEMERHIRIEVEFRCDYCGKELIDEPIVYKRHNKIYIFCCKICLREFKALE